MGPQAALPRPTWYPAQDCAGCPSAPHGGRWFPKVPRRRGWPPMRGLTATAPPHWPGHQAAHLPPLALGTLSGAPDGRPCGAGSAPWVARGGGTRPQPVPERGGPGRTRAYLGGPGPGGSCRCRQARRRLLVAGQAAVGQRPGSLGDDIGAVWPWPAWRLGQAGAERGLEPGAGSGLCPGLWTPCPPRGAPACGSRAGGRGAGVGAVAHPLRDRMLSSAPHSGDFQTLRGREGAMTPPHASVSSPYSDALSPGTFPRWSRVACHTAGRLLATEPRLANAHPPLSRKLLTCNCPCPTNTHTHTHTCMCAHMSMCTQACTAHLCPHAHGWASRPQALRPAPHGLHPTACTSWPAPHGSTPQPVSHGLHPTAYTPQRHPTVCAP